MTNTEKRNQEHRFVPTDKHEVKMFSEYTGDVQWYPLKQALNLVKFYQYKTVCPNGEFDRSLFTAEKRLKK
jgi:hypothetical protein